MLWAMFGVLLVLIVLSIAVDIENAHKFDGEGVGRRTVTLVIIWASLGISREFIAAIDPLL